MYLINKYYNASSNSESMPPVWGKIKNLILFLWASSIIIY